MTSSRLSTEPKVRLGRLAAITDRTKTIYIRLPIEDHIDALKDRYIADHHPENPDEHLTSRQVRQKLGLEA